MPCRPGGIALAASVAAATTLIAGSPAARAFHQGHLNFHPDRPRNLLSFDARQLVAGHYNLRQARRSTLTPAWLAPYVGGRHRATQSGSWTHRSSGLGLGALVGPTPLGPGWYTRTGVRAVHSSGRFREGGRSATFATTGIAGEASAGYRWGLLGPLRAGVNLGVVYIADEPVRVTVRGERRRLDGYPGFAWRYGLRLGLAF